MRINLNFPSQAFIENVIKSKFVQHDEAADKREMLLEETAELKDVQLRIRITTLKERAIPKLPWINVALADDITPRYVASNAARCATFNLVDFQGNLMTLQQLNEELERVFGISQTRFTVTTSPEKRDNLEKITKDLAGKTLFVVKTTSGKFPVDVLKASTPFSKFVNKNVNGREVTTYIENPVQN
jgi:hypothetical protein